LASMPHSHGYLVSAFSISIASTPTTTATTTATHSP
jgi:hypothetical protein